MIKMAFQKWQLRRKQLKLSSAVKTVEEAGFVVCNIQTRANAKYLVYSNGTFYKIGRAK